MMKRIRSVSVRKLPEEISVQRQQVYNDLEGCLRVDRPAVVLDCSRLRLLDSSGLHLLLCCLEEAMKRNGDLRLASVSPEILKVLEKAEIDSLFQLFETVGDAIESFRRPQFEFLPTGESGTGDPASAMNAA